MNTLFQLKPTIEITDSLWDVVTCAKTKDQYFLCGPADPSLEEFMSILNDFGHSLILVGRMNASSYVLPFPGPTGGKNAIGSFVKVYLGESQVARAKKEFDSMTYLGSQSVMFPNMITSKNVPTPRILFDRLLLLPLVLSTPNLKKFCEAKKQFYETHFHIPIDLEFVQSSSPTHLPYISNRQRIIEMYKQMAVNLLFRQQLDVYAFTHGDAVKDNIILENGKNLAHRLTGEWPKMETSLRCIDGEDTLEVYAPSWPVLIDYDTVTFPSANYFQNLTDFFSETPYILNIYNQYDKVNDYTDTITDHVLPLIRKAVVQMVTGRVRKCCIAYLKHGEIVDPFLFSETQKPNFTFHQLHVTEQTEQIRYYLHKMSSLMVGILRVFNMTIEDASLCVKHINERVVQLQNILHCNPIQYTDQHILDIKIK